MFNCILLNGQEKTSVEGEEEEEDSESKQASKERKKKTKKCFSLHCEEN